jgi:hypothetical protein
MSGFQPLNVNTPFGMARGLAHTWRMKEAVFVVGYADIAQSVDDPQTVKQVFDRLGEGLKKVADTNKGTFAEKQIQLENHPGIEQRVDLFDGVIVQRSYLVGRRLYQAALVMKTTQRVYESAVLGVLDSVKILSDAEVVARTAAEVAKAEPSPLPQSPVSPRVGSDSNDDSLRGPVKTVLTESQDLSGTWSVQTKKRESIENYNEKGNLIRQESYDYRGNLSSITVYGYIDGKRVSNSGSVRHEYNPPPIFIGSAPETVEKKFDPRYGVSYSFKYDEKKRLLERTWFRSNGDVSFRDLYKYDGNQLEELMYSANGSLNQRYVSVLDEKGNKLERTSFETRDGSVRSKESYTYEFDSRGNWTKRTTSRLVMKDGREQLEPRYVDYRTLTYYK